MTTNDTPMTPQRTALSPKATMALAATFVLGGLGALVFWAVVLLSGTMTVTSPVEWIAVDVLLGFPLMSVVAGWRMLAER